MLDDDGIFLLPNFSEPYTKYPNHKILLTPYFIKWCTFHNWSYFIKWRTFHLWTFHSYFIFFFFPHGSHFQCLMVFFLSVWLAFLCTIAPFLLTGNYLWKLSLGTFKVVRNHNIAEITHYVSNFRPYILFTMETMTSNINRKQIIRGLHLQSYEIIDSYNHSGGIFICWNEDNIQVKEKQITERCVHLSVLDKSTGSTSLVSCSYFPTQESDKEDFWVSMTNFYK